jgi:hypothetical protein
VELLFGQKLLYRSIEYQSLWNLKSLPQFNFSTAFVFLIESKLFARNTGLKY